MKPSNKKQTPGVKGFGFADAMFGIKDIAMQYQDIQGGPIGTKIQQKKPNTKINIVRKEPIPQKKVEKKQVIVQKKVEIGSSNSNNQGFKISSGKQFQNFSLTSLIPLQTSQNTFQLTLDGIQSSWQYNIFCDGLPSHMIVENPQISFKFQPTDVKQGGLGNCYFVSTLASLAHVPKILKHRIPRFKSYSKKDKSFQVNLFQSGKNIKVIVDNLFPKIFVKPVQNDISLMVLQKAYAQVYGNFQIINMGHSCDSLRDLTGAPTQYIDLKDKQQLTQKIQQIFKNKQPIIIASKVNVSMAFLSPKHSYNILDYKIQNKSLYLKLRDPRGCNCSQFPKYFQLAEKQYTNGIFWIDYKILVENFQVITVCKLNQNYKYFYKTFKYHELYSNQGCLTFRVKQKGHFVFSCHQKHKKFFDEKFSYQMLRILIGRIEIKNGKITPIQTICSDFKTQQVCSVQADLEPGQYVMFGKIGLNKKPKMQNQAITFSIYTSLKNVQSIQFKTLKGNISIGQFLKLYISQHKQQFKQSASDQKLYRYLGPLYGYLCMYYENKSVKSAIQNLQFATENITISENKISIGPNEQKILIHAIGEANNCSHKFSFKAKTIYKS